MTTARREDNEQTTTTTLNVIDRTLDCDDRTRRAISLMFAVSACVGVLLLGFGVMMAVASGLTVGVIGAGGALVTLVGFLVAKVRRVRPPHLTAVDQGEALSVRRTRP